MRFAAKMTALITMLLAVSLAVGGYLVMSSSFDARLKGQVRDAQEGVRLLGMTVQAHPTMTNVSGIPHTMGG